MEAKPPDDALKNRWRDVFAFVAAVAIPLPVVKGVRALTSEQLGSTGGLLAGAACAGVVVVVVILALYRLPASKG